MPAESIGRERSRAGYRLLGLVYLVTLYPFVLAIGLLGGLIFMIGDLVVGLFKNEGLSASSGRGFAGIAARLYRWPLDQLGYVLVGEPETFRFLP